MSGSSGTIGAVDDLIVQLKVGGHVWPQRREILDELEVIQFRMLEPLGDLGPSSRNSRTRVHG